MIGNINPHYAAAIAAAATLVTWIASFSAVVVFAGYIVMTVSGIIAITNFFRITKGPIDMNSIEQHPAEYGNAEYGQAEYFDPSNEKHNGVSAGE